MTKKETVKTTALTRAYLRPNKNGEALGKMLPTWLRKEMRKGS